MSNRIHVKAASKSYDVVIGGGLLPKSGELIKEVLPKATKLLLVSETNVSKLYLDTVKASLEASGFSVFTYIFEAGERQKNIESIAGMWEVMAVNAFTRTDAVVGLGGGVTTDMAGFAAASFLRGIAVAQIPTSLLAQVDASVGGKTGIDLPKGKNLVGAFHQPSIVIEDIDTLKTLPAETFTEGMAEVIKYAFIMDTKLYGLLKDYMDAGKAMLLSEDTEFLTEVVRLCVQDKADVIEQDENDSGLRQTLNYGHTIGHVIERDSNFLLAHGVSVAKGMGIISNACYKNGLADKETADAIKAMIEGYGLPSEDDITPEQAVSGVMNDKKKRGNTISLILVNKIGVSEICKMTSEEVLAFLSK